MHSDAVRRRWRYLMLASECRGTNPASRCVRIALGTCWFRYGLALHMQEYCNGGSLADAISNDLFGLAQTRLHWRRVLAILMDVAYGMAYIHSMRISHGDLNPANVLLSVRSQPVARVCSIESGARVWRCVLPPQRNMHHAAYSKHLIDSSLLKKSSSLACGSSCTFQPVLSVICTVLCTRDGCACAAVRRGCVRRRRGRHDGTAGAGQRGRQDHRLWRCDAHEAQQELQEQHVRWHPLLHCPVRPPAPACSNVCSSHAALLQGVQAACCDGHCNCKLVCISAGAWLLV